MSDEMFYTAAYGLIKIMIDIRQTSWFTLEA